MLLISLVEFAYKRFDHFDLLSFDSLHGLFEHVLAFGVLCIQDNQLFSFLFHLKFDVRLLLLDFLTSQHWLVKYALVLVLHMLSYLYPLILLYVFRNI